MRRPILTLSQFVLALGLSRGVAAQLFLTRGDRIIVTVPTVAANPVVGIAESMRADTILVRTSVGALSAFLLNEVTRIELSSGVRRPMWSRTAPLWMPLTGAGLGAIGGAAKPASRTSGGDSAEFAAIVGGIFGFVAGVVAAIAVPRREHWDTVPTVRTASRTLPAPSLSVAPLRAGWRSASARRSDGGRSASLGAAGHADGRPGVHAGYGRRRMRLGCWRRCRLSR